MGRSIFPYKKTRIITIYIYIFMGNCKSSTFASEGCTLVTTAGVLLQFCTLRTITRAALPAHAQMARNLGKLKSLASFSQMKQIHYKRR